MRIDDRFIHGQVAVGWVKTLNSDQIIVANDTIATDDLQRTLMEMAKPPNVEVDILTVEEVIYKITDNTYQNKRIILLIDSPKDALRLVKNGIKIGRLNIGGMRFKDGKKQITRTVSIDNEDHETFRALNSLGIELELRAVPTDTKIDFMNLLK